MTLERRQQYRLHPPSHSFLHKGIPAYGCSTDFGGFLGSYMLHLFYGSCPAITVATVILQLVILLKGHPRDEALEHGEALDRAPLRRHVARTLDRDEAELAVRLGEKKHPQVENEHAGCSTSTSKIRRRNLSYFEVKGVMDSGLCRYVAAGSNPTTTLTEW